MYPAFIDLKDKACLLVGGGAVAAAKADHLLQSHARLTVISPEISPALQQRRSEGAITWLARPYQSPEAKDYFLIIAATNDSAVNEQISLDAKASQRLFNAVDQPALCNFFAGAAIRRGHLQIAVSTEGAFPALAKHLRRKLEDQFPEAYGSLLEKLEGYRKRLMATESDAGKRKATIKSLLDSGAIDAFLKGDESVLNRRISG
ncbi:MAG: hypothetical protein A2293_01555 [Elusimicrobia bacterium RIFOXYB2_FULL_49_7]|nr:MAG: hypothetical protein A2293_01555 [Elusimicrobia bacterium RIFOXYB2_FULL_49_7]